MAITIKDVAARAKVSVATVSRAINDSANVSAEKKRRVQQAIQELEYTPNAVAQHMTQMCLDNIGVVLSHSPESIMQSPYVAEMLLGFATALEDTRWKMLLVPAKDEAMEAEKCCKLFRNREVQGFILMGARTNDVVINTLHEHNIPFVVLGRPMPSVQSYASEVFSVDTDNVQDVKSTTQYLIGLGHRRIAFIHSSKHYVVNNDRFDGYALGLSSAGIPLDHTLIFECGYTMSSAQEACAKLLSLPTLPTAVITTDDVKAVAFIKAATEHGLRVPEDISVFGHNNYAESELASPSLSTVHVPIYQLAVTAANTLVNHLEDPALKASRTVLPTTLVLRNSVCPPKN